MAGVSNWHGRVCVSDCDWVARIRTRTKVRPCVRVGMVRLRVRKGENGALLQVEIRGLSPFSNSANLSHLVFCETLLAGRIIVLALGPWTPSFRAPLGRFLPIQARQSAMGPHCGVFCRSLLSSAFAGTSDWVSAECFCEGLWPGFGSGRACDGLLQGILWSLSHDLLRRLAINVLQRKSCVCAWTRVSSCSENLALASGAGIVSQRTPVFAAESITIQCSTTVFRAHGREDRRSRAWNDQRPPSRIEACARGENGYPKARIVVASKPH